MLQLCREDIHKVQEYHQKIPAVLNDRSPAQAQHYQNLCCSDFKAVMLIASSIHFKITGKFGS